MKKLSREEMKKVMGGNPPKVNWLCLVMDGTPGGAYYRICRDYNAPPVAPVCEYVVSCTDDGQQCSADGLCVA